MTSPSSIPQSVIAVPDGSVVITPAQQYAEQQKIRETLERLVATVDPALADIREDIASNRSLSDTRYAELTASIAVLSRETTVLATTLRVVWGALGFLAVVLGVVAAVWH